ncbi:MAG: rod shape-determining protein MreD [Actinobacteria bacterium QS_5_72_10]|nr:MAG: rod shape-determining protein MreD [Actinobacteria bacterium QS_5_72_10]
MIARVTLLSTAALVAVLLDTVVLADLTLVGVAPATVPVMVIAVAFSDGPGRAMALGFGVGLLSDLISTGLVGVSALVLVLVAYAIGVARRLWMGGELTGKLLARLWFLQIMAGQVLTAGLFGLLLTPLIMPLMDWLSRQVADRLTGS